MLSKIGLGILKMGIAVVFVNKNDFADDSTLMALPVYPHPQAKAGIGFVWDLQYRICKLAAFNIIGLEH